MKCSKCGKELIEGEKFCGKCGCPVDTQTAQPQYTASAQQTTNAQTAGKNDADDKKIVLQIFAGIFTVVFAISFLTNFFGGIGNFFRSFSVFGYYGVLGGIFTLLLSILRIIKAVVKLVFAVTLLYTLLQWTREKAQVLFVTAAEIAAADFVIVLFATIIDTIYRLILQGNPLYAWLGVLKVLIVNVIILAVYFGILYLMNVKLELTFDKDMLMNAPKTFFNDASAYVKGLKKDKAPSASNNAANTSANNTSNTYNANTTYNTNNTYTAPGNPAVTTPVAAPAPTMNYAPAAVALKTDRSLIVLILLNLVTCGIYNWFFIHQWAKDVNVACAGDNQNTPGLLPFILLSMVTCGIYSWIWYYKLGNRLAANAPRYGLSLQENGTTIIMWLIFGIFLCGIGSLVGMNIAIKNTNIICAAYNNSIARN